MDRQHLRIPTSVAMAAVLSLVSVTATAAQSGMPSCMVGVTAQPLAQAMPPDAGGDALVVLRLTIDPSGGFQPHTHPGVVTASVVSGSLDFTLLEDDDMVINRAPVDGTAVAADPVTPHQAITANPGDWFVEAGSIHEAWNRSDQPAVLIVTGLVDPNQPFVQCVDQS